MDIDLKKQMTSVPDLRHQLRQLRWFMATFRKHSRELQERYGVGYTINEKKLSQVFLQWIAEVNANKHFAKIDSKDFITYAAGLVLRELIRTAPAKVNKMPKIIEGKDSERMKIIRFWPEGFLYTNYCLCAIAAVQQQEFESDLDIDTSVDELRTWWSFKENTHEIPGYAIAFLDKFLGGEPNWKLPDYALARPALNKALAGSNMNVFLH